MPVPLHSLRSFTASSAMAWMRPGHCAAPCCTCYTAIRRNGLLHIPGQPSSCSARRQRQQKEIYMADPITLHIYVMGLAMLVSGDSGKDVAVLLPEAADAYHYSIL